MKDEDALVKSVYLSSGRYEDEEERARYMEELDGIGALIRNGRPPSFDLQELKRLQQQKRDVESVSWLSVFYALFRIFLPGIIFLAILYGLILLLRLWRSS